jgi:hypothetical protein
MKKLSRLRAVSIGAVMIAQHYEHTTPSNENPRFGHTVRHSKCLVEDSMHGGPLARQGVRGSEACRKINFAVIEMGDLSQGDASTEMGNGTPHPAGVAIDDSEHEVRRFEPPPTNPRQKSIPLRRAHEPEGSSRVREALQPPLRPRPSRRSCTDARTTYE